MKATQKELAEALDMTPEEMDRAAHRLLQVETQLAEAEDLEPASGNDNNNNQGPSIDTNPIHSPAQVYSEEDEEEDTRL